jgi:hypothetical protein
MGMPVPLVAFSARGVKSHVSRDAISLDHEAGKAFGNGAAPGSVELVGQRKNVLASGARITALLRSLRGIPERCALHSPTGRRRGNNEGFENTGSPAIVMNDGCPVVLNARSGAIGCSRDCAARLSLDRPNIDRQNSHSGVVCCF